MKQSFLFLFILLLLLMAACKKDTSIEGTVTDIKTGKPIAGVRIDLAYTFSQQYSFKIGEGRANTDQNGDFYFTADQGDYVEGEIYISHIIKNGYSAVFDDEIDSKSKGCSHHEVKMLPLDGLLKLTIVNETGMHDSIYVEVITPCEYLLDKSEGTHRNGLSPLILEKGKIHTQTFGSCVGDTSPIQWRFAKNSPWLYTDSLLVKTADTTFFKIAY